MVSSHATAEEIIGQSVDRGVDKGINCGLAYDLWDSGGRVEYVESRSAAVACKPSPRFDV